MFKKTLLLLLLGLVGGVASVSGQGGPPKESPKESSEEIQTPERFWQATLGGGHYIVPLSQIISVSRHKYLLDSVLMVNEVTIDTPGAVVTRFYFISPVTDRIPGSTGQAVKVAADRGKEIAETVIEKTKVDFQNMVVKKYPDTTHARTVEYRLLAEKDLSALYTSVKHAWVTNRGAHFKAK